MKTRTSQVNVPHLSRGSVLNDLGFSPAESLELHVKAEIYRELIQYIRQEGYSQQELAVKLGIHQPDVSNLLNGRVSKFSVTKLIKLAAKLDLGAEVRLTQPKRPSSSGTGNSRAKRPRKPLACA
jgi:predicted XRE-type DNA-binding protein